ncbi:hypothetical protein [Actinomadura violacea]|uniref:DNA-binding protein n=1 Tax=Actinomadura violacea TaxID=2819934 RepID=A0ABS3S4I7_9ACTN|nr:hypothetical protein [Actinomadura violacea]MBO2463924.1 hypothetical protein [Actinomadura violacea]
MSAAGGTLSGMSIMPPADAPSSDVYLEWVRANDPAGVREARDRMAATRRFVAGLIPGQKVGDFARKQRGELPSAHLAWYLHTLGHLLCERHPRQAEEVYRSARAAGARFGGPGVAYRVADDLLFARYGVFDGARIAKQRTWLAEVLPAGEAHAEFARFACAVAGGAAKLPSDLHKQVRDSAGAASLDGDEEARVLGDVLAASAASDPPGPKMKLVGAAYGPVVPAALLKAAAKVFKGRRLDDAALRGIAELFPYGGDGREWLRMLAAARALDAMADGRIVPCGSLGAWVEKYAWHYCEPGALGPSAKHRQALPDELYDLLPRIAPRIAAEGRPLLLHGRVGFHYMDADLADACLAEGIELEAGDYRPAIAEDRPRRDLKALAAHPVLGPHLEQHGTGMAGGSGTAVSTLPESADLRRNVLARLHDLVEQSAGAGLAKVEDTVAELDGLLDVRTSAGLDGAAEELAAVDVVEPLLRTLRTGIPAELGWPLYDAALDEVGRLDAVTSVQGVLTVAGNGRAIAFDRDGRRGTCEYTVPRDEKVYDLRVCYVDGRFLVAWRSSWYGSFERGYWADRPGEVIAPDVRADELAGADATVRMPGAAESITVVAERDGILHGRAAPDEALLWTVAHSPARYPDTGAHAFVPPTAYWDAFVPRDEASSRALRNASREAVEELLKGAEVGAVLPDVTDPRVADGVAGAVAWARRILRHRDTIRERIAFRRSGGRVEPVGDARDSDLHELLWGLVNARTDRPWRETPSNQPAMVTSIAAAGAYLRGEVGERGRADSVPERPLDWAPLLGCIGAVALRLVGRPHPGPLRDAGVVLLREWARSPFARPGRWRRGTAPGSVIAPLREAGRTLVTGPASGELHDLRTLDPDRGYRFVQPADAPVPADAEDVEIVEITTDDATRLTRLLGAFAEHGPLKFDEAAAAAFTARTGARHAHAALLLTGLPMSPHIGEEKLYRGAPYKIGEAFYQETRRLLRGFGHDDRLGLLAAGLPDDPAALWEKRGTVRAAEGLAEAWAGLVGVRAPVPEDMAAELDARLRQGDAQAITMADPSAAAALAEDLHCRILLQKRTGPRGPWLRVDSGRKDVRMLSGLPDEYRSAAARVAWALTERPVGDPATAGAADLYELLRARLNAPELVLRLQVDDLLKDPETVFGPGTFPVEAEEGLEPPVVYDGGLLMYTPWREQGATRPSNYFLRPARLADDDQYAEMERLCAARSLTDLREKISEIEVLLSGGGLHRMVERSRCTPVPPGGFEANPLLSVPDLVAEVAGEHDLAQDAAALYLQLLTLSVPTDRNVRRWNHWDAPRHKAAQVGLAAAGLVELGKRARAGRSAFIPGRWTDWRSWGLPLESAKLAAYEARGSGVYPYAISVLPPAPLHELFADFWRSRAK